jgi:hypothetical protein
MSTGLAIVKRFERFPVVVCPGCAIAMMLKEMHPISDRSDLYTATYHCNECGTETSRRLKRDNDPRGN